MAKQSIYYLVRDGGDGSATVDFFDSEKAAELLIEHNPDEYAMNEGSPGSFEVDGVFDLGRWRTMKTEASVLQYLKDQGLYEEN
jgi:hypothetical protein